MRAGMYAEVRIPRAAERGVLGVSASAVKRSGDAEYLFVAHSVRETVEVPRKVQPDAQKTGLGEEVRKRMARLKSRLGSRNPGQAEADNKVVMENKEVEVWRARRVDVRTGLRAEGYVQVLGDALTESDWIVSSPRDDLKDGARLRVIEGNQERGAGDGA
jgi:hypothetical protein